MWIQTNNRLPDVNQAVLGNIQNCFVELRYMATGEFVKIGFAELGGVDTPEWMPILYVGTQYIVSYMDRGERYNVEATYAGVENGSIRIDFSDSEKRWLMPHEVLNIVRA